MLTPITPVFENDIEALRKEFFHPHFETRNLGQSGKWLGPGLAANRFANPVQWTAFESWLRGTAPDSIEPKRNPEDPLAWRTSFETGRSATTLWALGTPEVKNAIEEAHANSVRETFDLIQKKGFIGVDRKALFPAFQSGTGDHQIPYLHTDAFLTNPDLQYLRSGPQLSTGTVESFRSRLETQYVIRFGPSLEITVGAIDSSPESDVQRRLFKGFKKENDQGKFYEGKELFAAWREEAKTHGVGPEKIASVLRSAAEMYQEKLEYIRAESNPLAKMRATFSDWLQKRSTPIKKPEKSKDNELTHSR